MRALRRVLILAIAASLLCAPAMAGTIDLPVKWSQLPDMGDTGRDERAEHPIPPLNLARIVADDWLCTSPLPVIAVRWWGSYLDLQYQPDTGTTRFLPFEISLHEDGPSAPFSQPGAIIAIWDRILAQEHFYGQDGNGKNVYEYNAYLPVPFQQTPGQVYWIDIELNVGDPVDWGGTGWGYEVWGWHNTDDPWRDVAVYSDNTIAGGPSHLGPWAKIGDGPHDDMAFELMVIPEPVTVLGVVLGVSGLAGYIRRRRLA